MRVELACLHLHAVAAHGRLAVRTGTGRLGQLALDAIDAVDRVDK